MPTRTPHHHRAGSAGHDDHHLGTRRRFLRQLGLVSAGTALLPHTPLTALGSASLTRALSRVDTDHVLVLIRLKGGNDGLNTIVPLYAYDRYRAARPQLAYREAALSALTDELAVPADFAGAEALWQRGAMRIVNGVGYPDPSLSHFRGTDIKTSASRSDEVLNSGWLGRHLGGRFPDYLTELPAVPPAIQIGGSGSLTFTNEENVSLAVSVNTVEELAELAERGELYDTTDLPACAYGAELGYLRSVANASFGFAGVIREAYDRGANADVDYPAGSLGLQLAVVARLIKGRLGTGLYLVTLDGFDTHAGQGGDHPARLAELGGATRAFFDDLAAGGHDERVLAATFSEFGRRIEENVSGGTDHGTAAPQLLFGPALGGSGAHGALPDLGDPDADGNLRFTTDFRSVYATLLERWMCVPAGEVDSLLGGSFARLELGLACTSTGVGAAGPTERSLDVALRAGRSGWLLAFATGGGRYEVEVYGVSGQRLGATTHDVPAGEALVPVAVPRGGGAYAYRLSGPGGVHAAGVLPALR